MNLQKLVRKNIWDLKAYSSARDEYHGDASVFLDANENPYNGPYNRYPDPLQWEIKEKISKIKDVAKENILLGNGSDEAIDLIIRIFCEPRIDNIVTIDPTYGMYQVVANINDVEYKSLLLDENFDFKASELLALTNNHTKVIFLCSPNNPSGNSLDRSEILEVVKQFEGIVVIDEAYIDFSSQESYLKILGEYPNLVVLQTFSKAWASAGVRLGLAYANEDIIRIMNKVKYPYNINKLTQEYAIDILSRGDQIKDWIKILLQEREVVAKQLEKVSCVEKIYPSDSNYLLIKVKDANATYNYLVNEGVIVRNRHNISLCMNCLRITIGSREENEAFIHALQKIS